jgi:Uma2 family endonuclease
MYAAQTDDLPLMTVAEYLAFADDQEIKYEYHAGIVYAMTGASVRHNTITANAIAHLIGMLGERDCTVTTSDTRVFIDSTRSYRYPDVTVFCDEPAYWEERTDTITNPALLVEVLSPGTAVYDYNDKLEEYTQIASLQAYVIISQDKPKVEVYRRDESGKWIYEFVTGLDAEITVPIDDTNLRLSLAEIYRRVRWGEDGDPNNDP